MTDLLILADRVEGLTKPTKLKFGIWPTGGWVISTSRETVTLLCDLWNARADVAKGLRTIAANQENPSS